MAVQQLIRGLTTFPTTSAEFDRIAEKALLGCVLHNPGSFTDIRGKVTCDYFFVKAHQSIYQALLELADERIELDEINLGARLNSKGQLNEIGGFSYLTELLHSTPLKRNLAEYVEIVTNYYFYRQLFQMAQKIALKSQEKSENVESLLFELEQQIAGLRQQKEEKRLIAAQDVFSEVFDLITERSQSNSDMLGLETGFVELDALTLGLQPADLIIVAARPSMGKTAFALNIATHLAVHQRQCVYFFSLEMSRQQLAMRLFSAETEIHSKDLKMGKIKAPEWEKLVKRLTQINDAPLYICDISGLGIAELHALAKTNSVPHKPAIIVVDYLQLLHSVQKYPNREQEISEISRSLKALAKDLNVPVIALSQLNRAPDGRANKRPLMSDIRESGSIEQDADIIMFLYRDEVYNPETPDKGVAEVIIAKHRNGEIGVKKLAFVGQFTKFGNLDFAEKEYEAYDPLN